MSYDTDDNNTIETTFHSECFVKKNPTLLRETAHKLQNLKSGGGGAMTSNESGEWGAVITLKEGFIFMTDMCVVLVVGSQVTPVDEELAQSIIRNQSE